MDNFGSTIELVREVEDVHTLNDSVIMNNSLDDSSSGYGSDETDDGFSTGQFVNLASKPQIHHKTMRDEVMLYTSTNSLLQGLECMITMPEMCDVTFLVGHQRTPIHGVKAIMMTRSRVLYQIILSCQKEVLLKSKSKKSTYKPKMINGRLTINIDGYDDATFRRLNQFVHCGKAQIDIQTVVGLLCAALEFRLSDLKQACRDFVNKIAMEGRISELEMSCADYSSHSVARKLLETVQLRRKETVV